MIAAPALFSTDADLLRVLADGLIQLADKRPRRAASCRLLRDAAASALDAASALKREGSN